MPTYLAASGTLDALTHAGGVCSCNPAKPVNHNSCRPVLPSCRTCPLCCTAPLSDSTLSADNAMNGSATDKGTTTASSLVASSLPGRSVLTAPVPARFTSLSAPCAGLPSPTSSTRGKRRGSRESHDLSRADWSAKRMTKTQRTGSQAARTVEDSRAHAPAFGAPRHRGALARLRVSQPRT
jgi:hypothetical protein